MVSSTTLAVIFDFDDTLVPDSTSEFLKAHGIDPEHFWLTEVKALVDDGYDPTLAYLKRIFDNSGDGKPLGQLTNKALSDFGSTLDSKFFHGIPQVFEDLRDIVSKFRDMKVEFYIVSGGLESIIRGSQIVNDQFDGVYGCQLAGDTSDGPLRYIKRAITFTEKTRYVFEINKGIPAADVLKTPYLVNRSKPHPERRIRFPDMIYVGDGLTDIPCFSLVMGGAGDPEGGGLAFAVFDPSKDRSAKQALQEYLIPRRVVGAHAPDYTKEREMGALLRASVAGRCSTIKIKEELAGRT